MCQVEQIFSQDVFVCSSLICKMGVTSFFDTFAAEARQIGYFEDRERRIRSVYKSIIDSINTVTMNLDANRCSCVVR